MIITSVPFYKGTIVYVIMAIDHKLLKVDFKIHCYCLKLKYFIVVPYLGHFEALYRTLHNTAWGMFKIMRLNNKQQDSPTWAN